MEAVLSITTLTVLIWLMRFLIPRAIKERDAMAVTCVLLTLIIAVVLWFLIGASKVQ